MPQDRGRALRQRDVPKLVHVPACGVPGITSNPERSALEALEAIEGLVEFHKHSNYDRALIANGARTMFG